MNRNSNLESQSLRAYEADLMRVAEVLRGGGVALFPTDTAYVIGCSVQHSGALDRVFRLKERDRACSLPLLLSRPEVALEIAALQEGDLPVLKRIWPGPWTLVFRAKARLKEGLTGPDGTVALRCPDHGLALEVLRRAGDTLAVSSANFSGSRSPSSFEEIDPAFLGKVDAALDAGPCPLEGSTAIARVDQKGVEVVRTGCVSREEVARVEGLLRRLGAP